MNTIDFSYNDNNYCINYIDKIKDIIDRLIKTIYYLYIMLDKVTFWISSSLFWFAHKGKFEGLMKNLHLKIDLKV